MQSVFPKNQEGLLLEGNARWTEKEDPNDESHNQHVEQEEKRGSF
jgi:hypothetical protein